MERPRIELDDVDIGILAFLSDVPESTTTEIVRALFKPPFNIRKLDSFIRYRLNRFVAEGIIKQSRKNRKMIYNVGADKVFFGEGVLQMNGVGDVDMGYFIVVKKDDETIAKSIDDYERRIGAKKIFSEQPI